MQIIPVIDIRNGVAVRAVGGRRDEYRAIKSRLTESVEPAEVLTALRDQFQSSTCYVADLDAIERGQINRCTIGEMARTGVSLIVDAGVTTIEQVESLLEIRASKVVLASESIADLTTLKTFLNSFDCGSLVFSIDLKHGELLVEDPLWEGRPPLNLARFLLDQGFRQFIVLDLAAVGTGDGIQTLKLCREIRDLSSDATIISGGGVDSHQCIQRATEAGLNGLLIASALHDGRLTPSDLGFRSAK
jgi:phosphoribosylformimino-5-aminoimidazole carboxamide ribotide isomerase